MTKDDCIFCKLANGVFPTHTVYEDEDFRVILDASPANYGHSLIIPKQHSDNLFSLDEETARGTEIQLLQVNYFILVRGSCRTFF